MIPQHIGQRADRNSRRAIGRRRRRPQRCGPIVFSQAIGRSRTVGGADQTRGDLGTGRQPRDIAPKQREKSRMPLDAQHRHIEMPAHQGRRVADIGSDINGREVRIFRRGEPDDFAERGVGQPIFRLIAVEQMVARQQQLKPADAVGLRNIKQPRQLAPDPVAQVAFLHVDIPHGRSSGPRPNRWTIYTGILSEILAHFGRAAKAAAIGPAGE